MKNQPYYIGLLSGTSADSIDAALWSFHANRCELIQAHQAPIGPKIRQHILDLSTDGYCHLAELGRLDNAMGHLFANAAIALIKQSGIEAEAVAAIGSHGQTLWHDPNQEYPFSIQIGDANIIAQKTNITTISDFRRADIALGGQGAPLAPAFHKWLLQDNQKDQIVVNIGGISNISVISHNQANAVIGYDTGPGNALMDAWCSQQWQQAYDFNGEHAASGQVLEPLLSQCLRDPYFAKTYPKSTGRETFNLHWLNTKLKGNEKPEDVQATLCALTARCITDAIMRHSTQADVFICGGGVHNFNLIQVIQNYLGPNFDVQALDNIGVAADWVESGLFAWLAKERLEQKPIDLRHITGAKANTLLGCVYTPSADEYAHLAKKIS